VQIGAMQHEMRRAKALDVLVAEIEPVPGLARAPVPQLATLGPDLHPAERRFQAEREQDARAVGADLDAGADLPELARLLVDLDVDAAREQGERRGQATDARADHDDLLWRAHGLIRGCGWSESMQRARCAPLPLVVLGVVFPRGGS
jgi:hypothetical protein